MCSKSAICPEFERRTANGITSACDKCEYIKQERRKLKRVRIAGIIVFFIFAVSTLLVFN